MLIQIAYLLQVESGTDSKKKSEEEDEIIDIMTVDKIGDSSDDEDDLFYLPTVPDPDPR